MKHKALGAEVIQHICEMANIELDSSQIDEYREHLAVMLDYVALLEEVDENPAAGNGDSEQMSCPLHVDETELRKGQGSPLDQAASQMDGFVQAPCF